jgi:hypothetical protein
VLPGARSRQQAIPTHARRAFVRFACDAHRTYDASMGLTRSSRALVALVTAVLLLLCQTAFAAQACAHIFSGGNSSGASAPCHEGAGNADNAPQTPAAVSVCEAAKAVGQSVEVPLIAVTDLPSLPMAPYEAIPPRQTSPFPHTAFAVCNSPPLSLLHCRLLN